MSRYRQIIIHAGLSKTGTTSIQASCERYRARLEQRGIAYPAFSFAGKPFTNHSIALVTAVARTPAKYALGLRRLFGADAAQVAEVCRVQLDDLLANPQSDTLLLSSERIAGLDLDDMNSLRARLAPHAEALRLLVYIRSPESALESILQERVKAGAIVEPEEIAGRVRRRYEALERCFSDVLEPVNYHEAVSSPVGIVGCFMSLIGVPEEDIRSMSFRSENVRLSMEAFLLMDAINSCFPKQGESEHAVGRFPGDLNPLLALPGQAFQIPDFFGSKLHTATLEEASWLESRLGFGFPPAERTALLPLWQVETLDVLEQVLMQFENKEIRRLLATIISEQARAQADARPDTALVLDAISRRVTAGAS